MEVAVARVDRVAGPAPVVVMCGPSGVGKGTLVRRLAAGRPWITRVRSWTTRPRRTGDSDWEYVFAERNEFIALENQGDMVVGGRSYWGYLYGVRRREVCLATSRADLVLVEADMATVRALKQLVPSVTSLFVAPPSLDELARRVRLRARDEAAEMIARAEEAHRLLLSEAAAKADAWVVNDDLDSCEQQCMRLLSRLRSVHRGHGVETRKC